MECQGGRPAPRAYIYIYIYIYIYMRFALACVFSLQVYRGCVLARYTFKWFFVFRVLIWQKVFVIYRFRPLWLSRCVSGEGLVRSRWLALVAVAAAVAGLLLPIYKYLL